MAAQTPRIVKTGFILTLIMFLSVRPCPAVTPNLGRVFGTVTFSDLSQQAQAFLSVNPTVIPTHGSSDPVRLYLPGASLPNSVGAVGGYVPVNRLSSPNFLAVSYDRYPDVGLGTAGRQFLVSIDSVEFAEGSTYRFGTYNGAAPARLLTPAILPLTQNPSGTEFNISECPTLLQVNIKLDGAVTDIDALEDDPLKPVTCQVAAEIEEVAGSGDFPLQATSRLVSAPLATAKTTGMDVSFLARSGSGSVRLNISCTAHVKQRQDGFVLIPDPLLRLTPIAKSESLPLLQCGVPADVSTKITVERNAGKLTGYFDVSGHSESAQGIFIDSLDSNMNVSPLGVLPGSVPSVKWRFEGLPSGKHTIIARTLVDNGQALLVFPPKKDLNGNVNIIQGSEVDLGTTFVARPRPINGNVTFYDYGKTDLKDISFDSFTSNDFRGWPKVTSAEAHGSQGVGPAVGPCAGLSAGWGSLSQSVMRGNYDPLANEIKLSYSLLITGLSPNDPMDPGSGLDGSKACPTLWDIYSWNTRIKNQSVDEMIHMNIAQYLNFSAAPSEPPMAIEGPRICLGKQEIRFLIDPAVGSLKDPYIGFHGIGNQGTDISYVFGQAQPAMHTPSNDLTVPVTLPADFQYEFNPSIWVIPTANPYSSTRTELSPFNVPSEGFLPCGSSGGVCINMDDPNAPKILSMSFEAENDGCMRSHQELRGILSINSSGAEVAKITYVIDPPPPTQPQPQENVICPNYCGVDPQKIFGPPPTGFHIPMGGLSCGLHMIRFRVLAENRCEITSEYPFTIPEPVRLECPANAELPLYLGNEGIYIDDLRLDGGLEAKVTGGCPGVTISDDRCADCVIPPSGMTFHYEADGRGCKTSVMTTKPVEAGFLAYIEKNPTLGKRELQVYNLNTHEKKTIDTVQNDHARIAFSPNGVVALAQYPAPSKLSIYDQSDARKLLDIQFPTESPTNMAFRPKHASEFALVMQAASNEYFLNLYRGNISVARVPVPFSSTSSRITPPEVAWSSDGEMVALAYKVDGLDPQGQPYPPLTVATWRIQYNSFIPLIALQSNIEPFSPQPILKLVVKNNKDLLFGTGKAIYLVQNNTIGKIWDVDADLMDISESDTQPNGAVYLTVHQIVRHLTDTQLGISIANSPRDVIDRSRPPFDPPGPDSLRVDRASMIVTKLVDLNNAGNLVLDDAWVGDRPLDVAASFFFGDVAVAGRDRIDLYNILSGFPAGRYTGASRTYATIPAAEPNSLTYRPWW